MSNGQLKSAYRHHFTIRPMGVFSVIGFDIGTERHADYIPATDSKLDSTANHSFHNVVRCSIKFSIYRH